MSTVYIRHATYDDRNIRSVVFDLLNSDEAPAIGAGTRVLIKPNFLVPAVPEKAVTTHPSIVRAAAEFALEKGARVQISDSPAAGGFTRLMKKGGYNEAFGDLDVDVRPFEKTISVDMGEPFGSIDVAKDAMEADVVLNLAKLKTHSMMMLTLGVKNIFGCIVGLKKSEWHMRAGVDRHLFGHLIVSIHEAVGPAYTIVDGVLAMEGLGPGKSGTPRQLDLILGGKSAYAVDHVACLLVGMDPDKLETLQNAREMGVYDGAVHINGDLKIIDDFRFPELGSLNIGPKPLGWFMRKYVIQQPVADRKACKLCGECWKHCPAAVISHTDRGVYFDTDKCIRCYCCLEVCPHAAIRAQKPLVGKIWSWWKGISR
ncbi:MAG: (4Fe-4S)-binding protein [Proteobacteria bacterium]|nr:MAG: (4Fe-4S)-binding protein [Pseudomonadota bacterium]